MSQHVPIRLAGVSNMPTSYFMTTPERGDVYLRCGADILLNGLKIDLKAEARCPVCSSITRFRIANKRIEDLAPEKPVLHVVEISAGPGRVGVECESTHIFDKKECLTTWLSGYTGKKGAVTSLYDYMDSLTERLTPKGSCVQTQSRHRCRVLGNPLEWTTRSMVASVPTSVEMFWFSFTAT